jgi:subtilisin-like proprotein convertase family protein
MKFSKLLVLAVLLQAVGVYGQPSRTQTLQLKQGWNLISFQTLPDNPTPVRVMSGLSADPALAIRSLWSYDSAMEKWLAWSPLGGLSSVPGEGIQTIQFSQGYWLDVALPNLTLRITGTEAPDGRIHFGAGWNLLGFPSSEGSGVGLAQIDAIFRDHVLGSTADVDLIYALARDGTLLRWDFTIDRKEGDFNSDGAITPADQQFKFDFGLPDDEPALSEAQPTRDDFVAVLSGEGYWVHARRAFSLVPALKTLIQSDLDNAPQGNFPGPEDRDLDRDGVLDRGNWTPPAILNGADQSGIYLEAGQKTAQLMINNAGTGILRWEARFIPDGVLASLSDHPLTLDVSQGETLTDTDALNLSVDRTDLPPGRYHGQLELSANGGSRMFDVHIDVPEIVGDFRGAAIIDTVNGKSINLPAVDLFVSLFKSPDGAIRGQIRSDQSTHFPVPIPLQGQLLAPRSNEFISVASYHLPKNALLVRSPGSLDFSVQEGPVGDTLFNVDTINPFPRDVYRELVFVGDRTREDVGLTGSFFDTLIGVTADPIVIQGTFELMRESLDPSFQPTAGSANPCSILFGSDQQIPDAADVEKLFLLNGVLGCPPIAAPVLIEEVMVYAHLEHPNKSQLRIRLLSPTEDPANPNAGVLLYDGRKAGAPNLLSADLSWPAIFSSAQQGLFPQAGATALTDAYRGQRANQGDGVWRLGITDQVPDGSGGRLTKWTVSFVGPHGHNLAGRVVDSASNPVQGAEVVVTGAEALSSAVTGADGRFQFASLPPHRYRLTAQKLGYEFGRDNALAIDLAADVSAGDIVLNRALATQPDILISPSSGRINIGAGVTQPFAGTLRYVAPALVAGDAYRFILQRYVKDPSEPNPGEAGFAANLKAPTPVGNPVVIPASPSADPLVEFELHEAGIYSVTAIVLRGGNEVTRVGEVGPRLLERYTIRIDDQMPSGATGGNTILLAGGAFTSGGVVPFQFYPPATPPGSNLGQPPAAFIPVGNGATATADFVHRVDPAGAAQFQARLGEDMVRSVSADWNVPDVRPNLVGPAWNRETDPWRVNNPDLAGSDLNVIEPITSSPTHDFGRGPILNVGWITYDLLPGDGAPSPISCPGEIPDTPARCFVMTCSLGATINGRSAGGGLSVSSGARLELLSVGLQ